MGAGLRAPTLALTILSLCLCIAVIGCASKTISYFSGNHTSNVWLLPIWPDHFDTRELWALMGASVAVAGLNTILLLVLFVSALPVNLIVLVTTLLSTIVSIFAIAFTTSINNAAPHKDTLQSWTCRWSAERIWSGEGPPAQFASVCRETRFAFYGTIPIFVIQLLLLGLAIFAISTSDGATTRPSGGGMYDEEKSTSQHELGPVRQVSLETKSESPQSAKTGGKSAKGVQFA